jgi:phospholipase D1/2
VKAGHLFDIFMSPEDARKKLSQVKGHLVWHSLNFLEEAEMAQWGLQVNTMTESIYT